MHETPDNVRCPADFAGTDDIKSSIYVREDNQRFWIFSSDFYVDGSEIFCMWISEEDFTDLVDDENSTTCMFA